jgi:tRNA(Ile)-lysidine synthase
VWPALGQAFPEAEAALALSARHAQASAALAREVALEDLVGMADAQGLHLLRWRELGPARQRNALRGWLLETLGQFPPYTLVDRLMTELPGARSGRWPVRGGELRLHRGWLSCQLAAAVSPTAGPASQHMDLSQPGRVPLPAWGGELRVLPCTEHGVPPALLRRACVHSREGGEQFRLAPQATARSLKKQFQAQGLPAWERGGPLVSAASGQLLFVPGLGMDARAWAPPGQAQVRLEWRPAPAAPTGPGQPPG